MSTETQVKLRLLTPNDAQAFFDLRAQGLKLHPESFGEDYTEFVERSVADAEQRMTNADKESIIIGAFDEQLVGCIGLARKRGRKVRHKGFIWGMYVDGAHQRKGIGKLLMQQVVRYAHMMPGLEELQLGVVTTNEAAIRLYKSVGFTSYAVEPHALKIDGKYHDEHLMRLVLKLSIALFAFVFGANGIAALAQSSSSSSESYYRGYGGTNANVFAPQYKKRLETWTEQIAIGQRNGWLNPEQVKTFTDEHARLTALEAAVSARGYLKEELDAMEKEFTAYNGLLTRTMSTKPAAPVVVAPPVAPKPVVKPVVKPVLAKKVIVKAKAKPKKKPIKRLTKNAK